MLKCHVCLYNITVLKNLKKYLLLLICLFLILPNSVSADEVAIPAKSTINPDSYLYSLDRALEKVFYNFQFSNQSKANYYKNLLEERFFELNYIAGNKLIGQVENSSKRFAAQAGVLVDFINANNIEKESVKNILDEYKDQLPKLRDNYPANSSYWMLIQQDIDSINLYLEKLK